MTFTAKSLADGQVATSAGAIYTATATTYVKQVTFFNTNAADQTILVYINRAGTDRKIRRFVLAQNESADLLDGAQSIILENGDIIKAETTTTTAVDYVVWGVEET